MSNHIFAICAYKQSPYLESCIQTLMNQTVKSEIILVTSTPNAFIEALVKKYDLPYYINEGEGGITQDWNFAYSCAREYYRSKYITIAHQDDIYESDYTENVIKAMGASRKPLIFFSDYYEMREGRKVSQNKLLKIKRLMLFPLRFRPFQHSVWVRRRILSFGSPICCPSVTFAVDNLPSVVFRNHFRACEDWEAWESLSKRKGQFVYVPKLLMGHRIHEDSETSAIIKDHKRTDEEYEMFCKFWPKGIAILLVKQYSKGQNSNDLHRG